MADKANPLPPQLDGLYRTNPDLRPMLDFYIFFQKNVETELGSVDLPPFRPDQIQNRLSRSLSGFEAKELPIDIEAARRFIHRLAQADFPVMQNLWELVDVFVDHPQDLAKVCRMFIAGDSNAFAEWSVERRVVPDLASVVIKWALRPSMIRLREAVADHLNNLDWHQSVCPLCGAAPHLARLEKDSARTLACRVCGQEWRFPRLQCPFCGTDDRNSLAYLSADDESGYRIDICRECKRYIKTVDSREREEVLPMELEDILTQHLDLAARDREYSAP